MPVLFWNLHSKGKRAIKGREFKFQNKAHRTFDPRNALIPGPVNSTLSIKDGEILMQWTHRFCLSPPSCHSFGYSPNPRLQLNFGESTKHDTVDPSRWPRGTWIFNYVVNRIDIEKGIREEQRRTFYQGKASFNKDRSVYIGKTLCPKRNQHLTSSAINIIMR